MNHEHRVNIAGSQLATLTAWLSRHVRSFDNPDPVARQALAIVMASHGSTPGKPGTAMIVGDDGTVGGTVGGGALETWIVAAARQAIREGESRRWRFSLSSRQAADEGMICGGALEVLVYCPGGPGSPHGETLRRALRDWEAGRDCWLVYSLRPLDTDDGAGKPPSRGKRETLRKEGETEERGSQGGEAAAPDGRGNEITPEGGSDAPAGKPVAIGLGLLSGGDLILGALDGALDTFGSDPRELEVRIKRECRRREAILLNLGDRGDYFLLPLTSPITVIIAGAGHVARALAPLCRFAGFRTAVLDDRPEFVRREFFPTADHLEATPSFDNCFQAVAAKPGDYIVIATRGHLSDAAVLAQALATGAAYIGMLGSAKKREAIYRQLIREGSAPEALGRIHCPVGVAIGARTPEEIAVSIVAELIACRAAARGEK